MGCLYESNKVTLPIVRERHSTQEGQRATHPKTRADSCLTFYSSHIPCLEIWVDISIVAIKLGVGAWQKALDCQMPGFAGSKYMICPECGCIASG